MSSARSRSQSPEDREFLVSAELFVTTAAAAALRKANPCFSSSEYSSYNKRDSGKSSTGSEPKVKEKSSWLKGSAANGQWRAATCKLSEEGERCLFNIYLDSSTLYQTLYIHLLNHTDVRQADQSLFFKQNCIGIYCLVGQRWSSSSNNSSAEPVYLQFANADACNTWLTLLRSYAIPEIYGRLFFPEDGGSYRMWRHVELTVTQGRNLGNPKPLDGAESSSDLDPIDLDVSCDINLNNVLCGKTTIKKGIGAPEWHENFSFSDLPPFDNLEIVVWREKKLFKPTILGSVRIALSNFRRGEMMDGWFPVVQNGAVASDLRVGELRLKIRVDEEIILPYVFYEGLLQTFESRNFLDWMNDFENKLKLKNIAPHLMSIAVANNKLIEHVQVLASREVDGTPSSHQTLFRGNTILTKVMEHCMTWYGKPFLEASIGTVLRRLCAEKIAIEVDPVRSGKGTKDVEKNVDQLIYWCQEFWNQIYSVRAECPHEMRRLFETVRKLVEKRYQRSEPGQDSRELPWQSVSAFCFLRFIVPAILHPHLFGLCPGLPSPPVQRSLTLIAKVIQSLANLNATVQKEEFMRGVREFLKDSRQAMIDYILVVSTPSQDGYGLSLGSASDRHDRLNIVNSMRGRVRRKAALDREAIPILPHLLDIPRHLAILTSAVIRNSRDYLATQNSADPADKPLREFCSRCFEVEEQALQRVSQLATRISSNHKRPSAAGSWSQSPLTPISPSSPSSPTSSRRTKRPSTAPSSDTDKTRRRMMFETPLASPTRAFAPSPGPSPTTAPLSNLHLLKSPSTDSVPQFQTGSLDSPKGEPEDRRWRKGLFRGIWRRN
ncbi:GTPase activating protein [Mycena floridula]|nr:GTPase activating protein [Mycena floridula]